MTRGTLHFCMLMLASALMPDAARAADPVPEWLAQSRLLAQRLGTELKAELTSALASAGPTGAISVCRTRAPEIAARLSRESGAIVSRTALRGLLPPLHLPSASRPGDVEQGFPRPTARTLAPAHSRILEIGTSTRAWNLSAYPDAVRRIEAIDPDLDLDQFSRPRIEASAHRHGLPPPRRRAPCRSSRAPSTQS